MMQQALAIERNSLARWLIVPKRAVSPPPANVPPPDPPAGSGLKDALDALERLMGMFKIERVLYLIVSLLSFLLLIYAAFKFFNEKEITAGTLTAILGGSGLATVASARVALFFKRGFDLIEMIIKRLNRL